MSEAWLPYVVWVVIAIVVIVVSISVGVWLVGVLDRARRVARAHHAIDSEEVAEHLLRKHGFVVVGRQVQAPWPLDVNGQRVWLTLRADFIATKQGRKYVVEVKSGAVVTDPSYGPTRRQLLEYSFAFDTPHLLLLNADARTLSLIEFVGIDYAA